MTRFLLLFIITFSLLISGCSNQVKEEEIKTDQANPFIKLTPESLVHHWPNCVFYEIFVRSYFDSNGDGIGDIKGMTQQLDYLKELGIEAIWLMPINPSPSYHKYDVTDYYTIDPEYGSLEDFKHFIKEAHERDIKVIMDLVINHTSSQHPWFVEAKSNRTNKYRDWYVWEDDNTNVNQLGEWGQKVWHGLPQNRYHAVFWDQMPDLNFENPKVRQEIIKIGKYWLSEVGVDGFRLDAAKHVFSDNESKNYEWWQEFSTTMKETKADVFLVGEVWAPATVVAPYLEHGLQSAFNFDLSEKILTAANQEQDTGITSSLERVRKYYKGLSESYVDSTFITNHDMNRVMSQLNGNINHAKMAASLLLTLPGSPFIYYGEEIGMKGAKPDEYIREPMQWNQSSSEGHASWISPRHNLKDERTSVEEQLKDKDSLYNHYKEFIHVRRSSDVLVRGEIQSSSIREKGIIAFKRVLDNQSMLVLHNMSGKTIMIQSEKEAAYTQTYYSSDRQTTLSSEENYLEIELAPYSTIILVE